MQGVAVQSWHSLRRGEAGSSPSSRLPLMAKSRRGLPWLLSRFFFSLEAVSWSFKAHGCFKGVLDVTMKKWEKWETLKQCHGDKQKWGDCNAVKYISENVILDKAEIYAPRHLWQQHPSFWVKIDTVFSPWFSHSDMHKTQLLSPMRASDLLGVKALGMWVLCSLLGNSSSLSCPRLLSLQELWNPLLASSRACCLIRQKLWCGRGDFTSIIGKWPSPIKHNMPETTFS